MICVYDEIYTNKYHICLSCFEYREGLQKLWYLSKITDIQKKKSFKLIQPCVCVSWKPFNSTKQKHQNESSGQNTQYILLEGFYGVFFFKRF